MNEIAKVLMQYLKYLINRRASHMRVYWMPAWTKQTSSQVFASVQLNVAADDDTRRE